MGLKLHPETWTHVECDDAQAMQVGVHPIGDQYHVEKLAVQNPLEFIRLQGMQLDEATCRVLIIAFLGRIVSLYKPSHLFWEGFDTL